MLFHDEIKCPDCTSNIFTLTHLDLNHVRAECSTTECLFYVDIIAVRTPQTIGPEIDIRQRPDITHT